MRAVGARFEHGSTVAESTHDFNETFQDDEDEGQKDRLCGSSTIWSKIGIEYN